MIHLIESILFGAVTGFILFFLANLYFIYDIAMIFTPGACTTYLILASYTVTSALLYYFIMKDQPNGQI